MKTILFVLCLVILNRMTKSLAKEHFHVNHEMSWVDAKQYCEQNFTDLSNIESLDENNNLKVIGEVGQTSWIGLHKVKDKYDTYFWHWSDERCNPFRNWGNVIYGDCVEYGIHDALWSSNSCEKRQSFFCYDFMPELILVKENKTWVEALKHCRTHHKDLASLNSEKITVLAQRNITDFQTSSVWTGLRFLAGEWVWVHGDPQENQISLPSCPKRPFRCGARNLKAEGWENRDCEETLNFICFC